MYLHIALLEQTIHPDLCIVEIGSRIIVPPPAMYNFNLASVFSSQGTLCKTPAIPDTAHESFVYGATCIHFIASCSSDRLIVEIVIPAKAGMTGAIMSNSHYSIQQPSDVCFYFVEIG